MTAMYASLEKHGSLDLFLEEEPKFKEGESPEHPGQAVKALALDPDVMAKTGMVITEDDLAREFGYTDIGGWVPTKNA